MAKPRAGFTLVEMLVALSIVVAISATLIAFGPRINSQRRAARGAEQLQGWLLAAKNKAYRDQVVCGVTLLGGPLVTSLQYVEQPEDFTFGDISVAAAPNRAIVSTANDLTSAVRNNGSDDGTSWLKIEDSVGNPMSGYYRILSSSASALTLATQIGGITPQTFTATPRQYRIIRGPRPMLGEPSLQMPIDIAIDMNPGRSTNVSSANPTILFSPTGQASVFGVAPTGAIILWVRDTSLTNDAFDFNNAGEQSLIAIYPRTGLIGAFPVNPNPADPHLFTRDARAAGL